MPRTMFRDIYENKPGGMFAHVPSFTSGMQSAYDQRDWTYVHLDEALEMLIVRLLKSLNTTMLQFLERAGAWLLPVSHARTLIRMVTASSHPYGRIRGCGDEGEEVSPLNLYDRNAIQSSTVRSMVELMREKGFLSPEHRDFQTLRNVFGSKPKDLQNAKIQELILDMNRHGAKSLELHISTQLGEFFGPLLDSDVKKYLNGKRSRGVLTKQRQIPTVGMVISADEKHSVKTPKPSKDARKTLSDRRHMVTKLLNTLTLVAHKAIENGDTQSAEDSRKRWH
ncbi:hypothetical protein BWQ96_08049 [Gracilariopsis chorda]|uniref:Uncharacterized protein n=1 Tax=Gracilariopsis chorda TaxID=448386 RepID=A0A2V3IJH7_9FLOR|nr:hypothetical protein BWQ96_08049 [Gracilariopsis chorda]|eukprot:PXF42221.1 hypothetical protein BWQ96_08049 [Gracilariopsis chorda]